MPCTRRPSSCRFSRQSLGDFDRRHSGRARGPDLLSDRTTTTRAGEKCVYRFISPSHVVPPADTHARRPLVVSKHSRFALKKKNIVEENFTFYDNSYTRRIVICYNPSARTADGTRVEIITVAVGATDISGRRKRLRFYPVTRV